MKIIVSNVIEIINPSDDIIKHFKKRLTYVNPDYAKKQRMGFWVGKTPKNVVLYAIYNPTFNTKHYKITDTILCIPVGCFEELWALHPVLNDYIDYSVTRNADITSYIKLRDYQVPCVNAVKDYCNVIISMGCGMGKTLSALAAVGEIKQKTLWLAHTIDLIKQAERSCKDNMDCKTSFVSDGKMDLSGDIVFATVQSMYKFVVDGKISQGEFGCIVLDEAQHLSSNPSSIQTVRTVFEYFPAKYRIGLSATIWRSDGLHKAITDIIGNVKYNIVQNGNNYDCMYDDKCLMSFHTSKFQVPCKIIMRYTGYKIDDKDVFDKNGGKLVYTRLVNDITSNIDRNNLILNDLKNVDGSTIILSDRIEQLRYLQKNISNSVLITGSTPKKERELGLDRVRNGEIKYLFSSYQLAKEGLDIPILSNLFIASPIKTYTTVKQSVGRIQRPYGNKEKAIVYDYVDEVGMFYRYLKERRRIYLDSNWEIENIYARKEEK